MTQRVNGGALPDSFVLIQVDTPRPDERLLPGMHLRGSGWVIAEREVTEVAISLGERFLGYATYGEPRPEVAERFPHYPQSDACGFSFNLALGADIVPGSSDWVVVDVLTADGARSKKHVPVFLAENEESLPEQSAVLHGPAAAAIRLSLPVKSAVTSMPGAWHPIQVGRSWAICVTAAGGI